MSLTFRVIISIGLSPHSLLIMSFVAICGLNALISISSFSFVGSFIGFASGFQKGIFAFIL
jgi:hypothetical protein